MQRIRQGCISSVVVNFDDQGYQPVLPRSSSVNPDAGTRGTGENLNRARVSLEEASS